MIRLARLNEISIIAELDKSIFADPLPYEFMYADFINNPTSRYLIYEENNQIIGYAICWVSDNTSILNFAVKEGYRRKGIGSSLLEEVIKISNGAITLEVRVSNEKAINLYEKYGFIYSHTRSHYYSDGEDALFMVRWC